MSTIDRIKSNPNQLTPLERLRVLTGLGSIALLATASVALGVEKLDQPSPFEDTHPEKVTVTAGTNGNTETDLAKFINNKYDTADSQELLMGRLDDQDPGHDAALDAGEELTITVDVPDTHK
jgi:hypothetical protein